MSVFDAIKSWTSSAASYVNQSACDNFGIDAAKVGFQCSPSDNSTPVTNNTPAPAQEQSAPPSDDCKGGYIMTYDPSTGTYPNVCADQFTDAGPINRYREITGK